MSLRILSLWLLLLYSLQLVANIPTPFNKQANAQGNFSFTVTDFNLQVGGIPVQVNRTYSTLQRYEKYDFTYAWSIDYQNVNLQENIHLGREWRVQQQYITTPMGTYPLGYCFKTDK